jgi:glycosyltransferase involved in cell wall biosynthesis
MASRSAPQSSVCLIVRDSAHTLAACLASVKPWLDEIVVVDTGSTDDTIAISRQHGARVFEFPWVDDFSAARNESFRHARGEWLFWMDSDDTIDPANGRRLQALIRSSHRRENLGYVIQVHCPGPHLYGEDDRTVVDHVKLVRKLPNVQFEGRIHEQVLPSIRRLGGEVCWTDIYVVHSGSDQTAAGRKRKQERDLRILELDLAERPEHPFVLFNLGMTYADMDQHLTAIDYLRRSIVVSDPGESQLRKTYALLVSSLFHLGRLDDAARSCQEGLNLFPDDPELTFRRAVQAQHERRFEEARANYLRILRHEGGRHFSSIDPGILGFKARQNLAFVMQELGEIDRAEIQWRRILQEMPNYRLGWLGFVECLIAHGRHRTATIEIESMLKCPHLRCTGWLMKAKMSEVLGHLEAARAELTTALRDYPDAIEVMHALCRFLFDHGEPLAARQALERLHERQPHDASVLHNLGTINLRLSCIEAAVECYERSLRLRPTSISTLHELEGALISLGNREAAESIHRRAQVLCA